MAITSRHHHVTVRGEDGGDCGHDYVTRSMEVTTTFTATTVAHYSSDDNNTDHYIVITPIPALPSTQ